MNKTKPVWRKGAPPAIGWWPASLWRNPYAIRWWNGKWWSVDVERGFTANDAAIFATVKAIGQEIEWTDKWWL